MRFATAISLLAFTTGCHIALGLDEIDPGEADDDATANAGGGGTAAQGGATTSANGGNSTGGTSSTGGTMNTGGSTQHPYRGPLVGNYLLSGRLADSEAPEFYVTVTASSPDGVTLTSQPLHAEERTLVGAPTDYDDVPDVLPDTTEISLGGVTAPAEANPVAAFDVIAANVVLEFHQNDPPCGTLRGDLLAPLMQDLAGSTFFMTPVSSVDDLPPNPPVACP